MVTQSSQHDGKAVDRVHPDVKKAFDKVPQVVSQSEGLLSGWSGI